MYRRAPGRCVNPRLARLRLRPRRLSLARLHSGNAALTRDVSGFRQRLIMHSRKVASIACIVALLPLTGMLAAPSSGIPAHPDDSTIVHVLNRLGFGPSPGDVERVRRIGLEK